MSEELKYAGAPTATVSSLKSEQSTQRLLAAQQPRAEEARAPSAGAGSRSAAAGSARAHRRRALVLLGLAQVVLGAALLAAGALAVLKGAALARAGAGLWAGCVAVVAGVVGVLAGINDCYGLHGASGSPLLTAFLALSLLCLACGNSAAVLAGTGLQRDSQRQQPGEHASFQEEQAAWTPVLCNILVLVVAVLHCAVAAVSVYYLSKRVCPCWRRKPAFDHNQLMYGPQFDPAFKAVAPYVIHVDEAGDERRLDLARHLETRLQPDLGKKKKEEAGEFDSANSKEKLVTRWLGHHHSTEGARAGGAGARERPERGERTERGERVERIERIERGERRGVRKQRARPAPLVLLPAHPAHPGHPVHPVHPAHPASTLGRLPPACVMIPPRYATLPLPPAPLYYPVHDSRMRRRRSGRAAAAGRARRDAARSGESQLARSLERIHRKRRADRERLADAHLKRTYTGLDRAYAEQFIAVIDESRQAAELHDSLASTNTASASDSAESLGKDV